MRLLVCGSRTFTDKEVVRGYLYGVRAVGNDFVLIHGAAKGADSIANHWAVDNDVEALSFPADWTRYGKVAGNLRNLQMLNQGKPDLVVAFVDKPLAESRGTAHMVWTARKVNVKTVVVEVTS